MYLFTIASRLKCAPDRRWGAETKLINTIILKSAFHFGFVMWLLYLAWMHNESSRFPIAFVDTNPDNVLSI